MLAFVMLAAEEIRLVNRWEQGEASVLTRVELYRHKPPGIARKHTVIGVGAGWPGG